MKKPKAGLVFFKERVYIENEDLRLYEQKLLGSGSNEWEQGSIGTVGQRMKSGQQDSKENNERITRE